MTSFAIPIPEAGEHAILCIDVGDLERLQGELGDDYIQRIVAGLDNRHVGILRRVLIGCLKGGDVQQAINAVPIDELAVRLTDCLFLRLRGHKLSDGRAGEKSET